MKGGSSPKPRYRLEKRQDGGHGDQKSGCQGGTPNDKSAELAKEHGVSPRTVKNDAKFSAKTGHIQD